MFRAVFTVKLTLSLSGGEPGLFSHLLEGPACWKVPLSVYWAVWQHQPGLRTLIPAHPFLSF